MSIALACAQTEAMITRARSLLVPPPRHGRTSRRPSPSQPAAELFSASIEAAADPNPEVACLAGLSHVEAELDHVAVGHHVVLALDPHLACRLGGRHRAGRHQVVIRDDLGLDEALLEI